MRRVLLIRHGTHDEVGRVLSGRSEIALNDEGASQAERLSAWLAGEPIAALHTSPRRRAVETAAPLAARLALKPVVAPALDEIDFGAFTGRGFAELDGDPAWFTWNAERTTAACPGGETMEAALARAGGYLDALPAGTHALVSHCDVIRGVVAQVLGLPASAIFRFDCYPCSVTTLEDAGGGWRLVSLNERAR
jgi:broad specificity phosphatase PhoE